MKIQKALTCLFLIAGSAHSAEINAISKPISPIASPGSNMPSHLKGYDLQWKEEPRAAAMAWFKAANLGAFVTIAPGSSQVGEMEWRGKVDANWWQNWHAKMKVLPKEKYEEYLEDLFDGHLMSPNARKVLEGFTGENFDANKIADLALAAHMKYIVFTTQHVDGRMYLFKTATTPLNSVEMKPKRDFVAELAKACRERNLGLFLYVGPPHTDPVIRERYRTMLTELLTQYGPIAGIWFDGIGLAYQRNSGFEQAEVSRTYELVRKLQPHCLITFKTGYTGEEDYISPEWHQCTYGPDGLPRIGQYDADGTPKNKNISPLILDKWNNTLRHLPAETSTVMIMNGPQELWFGEPIKKVQHKNAEDIYKQFKIVRNRKQNFVPNIALNGDGSIREEDAETLRNFAQQLRVGQDIPMVCPDASKP